MVGAFIETLQDLRPALDFLAHIQSVELESGEEAPNYTTLDSSYLNNRYACKLLVRRQYTYFINAAHVDFIGVVRDSLPRLAIELGIKAIDLSSLLGPDREFTQAVSRYAWSFGYAGIFSPSSLGLPGENWTFFEDRHESNFYRVELVPDTPIAITIDHPDLIEALNALHMTVDGDTSLLTAERRGFGQVFVVETDP